jgi:hypothetical protein
VATANQRAIAIIENIINQPSTTEQRAELLAAFGDATTFIASVRAFILQSVRDSRKVSALATVSSSVDTDYPEAP